MVDGGTHMSCHDVSGFVTCTSESPIFLCHVYVYTLLV